MTAVLIAWTTGAIFVVWMLYGQVQHVRWRREGARLSRQFDELMQWRKNNLDPLVARDDRPVEMTKWLRVELELFFQRCERHSEARQRHLESWKGM